LGDTGRFQTGRVVSMAAGHTVHDTYTAFLAPLLPVFIDKLSLSITGAGLLTVFLQGPSLIQPAIGRFADRFNLRILVLWAPALAAVFMSLLGIAPNYAFLALLLTLSGINSAGLHAVGPIMTGNVSGSRLGHGMSFWMVGGELGRTLGPVIVVSIIVPLSLERMYWLMPLGLLISLLLFVRMRSIPYHAPASGPAIPLRTTLKRMGPVFLPLVVFISMRAFLQVSVTTFLPTYLTSIGADLWFAGATLTLLQGAGVLGALAAGSLSDRFGRRKVLLVCVVFAPISALIFLSTQGWIQVGFIFLLGFFVISPTPVVMALVQESFPDSRAFANGLYMGLNFVVRAVGIILVGIMGDYLGLHTAIMICAGLMFIGLPAVFALPVGNKSLKA